MSNKNKFWHGYLEAGEKSSPVLEDAKLNTDGDSYRYLYNLKADRIIKYKSDIVNAKLRDLKDDEQDIVPQLEKQYKKARKTFLDKVPASAATAKPAVQTPPENKAPETSIEPMESMDAPEPIDDMDWDEDSLEADAIGP